MRTDFVLTETAIGLRRNLSMTIAVILTVAISLMWLGIASLMREQVSTTKKFFYGNIEVSVYLTKDVTQPERNAVDAELENLPEVDRVVYVSQRQAYERAKVLFKGSPQLLRNITPTTLPESYLVKLHDPKKYPIVAAAVGAMPGVEEVSDAGAILRKLFRFADGMQRAALVCAIVTLIVALLLIFNTVRLAAYNRRRETGIMRLVGASDLYIQGPFVLEGAIAGLVGAGISLGLVSMFKIVFIDHGLASLAPNVTPYIGWGNVIGMFPWLIGLGVVLVGAISAATLQRYLRV